MAEISDKRLIIATVNWPFETWGNNMAGNSRVAGEQSGASVEHTYSLQLMSSLVAPRGSVFIRLYAQTSQPCLFFGWWHFRKQKFI